jgi:hypothetical protein
MTHQHSPRCLENDCGFSTPGFEGGGNLIRDERLIQKCRCELELFARGNPGFEAVGHCIRKTNHEGPHRATIRWF